MKKDSFVKEVIGEHIFNKFIDYKTKEWRTFNMQVHDWEIKNYLSKY